MNRIFGRSPQSSGAKGWRNVRVGRTPAKIIDLLTHYRFKDRLRFTEDIEMLQQLARSMLVDVDELEYELVSWIDQSNGTVSFHFGN
jgi:hypothetical protein